MQFLENLRSRFAEAVKLKAAQRGFFLIAQQGAERRKWIEEVLRIKRERTFLLHPAEACQIISAIKAIRNVPGDLAELGVAYGASAKLIAETGEGRRLHLFDTFGGLPRGSANDDIQRYPEGEFGYRLSTLESVKEYLGDTAKGSIVFHKGLFPATAEAAKDRTFAFVHLDADLYQSTLDGLKFFYPRLSPGGIILTHDSRLSPGVDKAFAEFFAEKLDPVIEMTGYQAMVVKLAA